MCRNKQSVKKRNNDIEIYITGRKEMERRGSCILISSLLSGKTFY